MLFTYGESLYKGNELQEIVPLFVKHVLLAHESTGAQILVSRGSSGCALATAVLMDKRLKAFSHLHCNKGNVNQSHTGQFSGKPIAGSGCIFIDDLIETGFTYNTTKKLLKKYAKGRNLPHCTIVAIVITRLCCASYHPRIPTFYVEDVVDGFKP